MKPTLIQISGETFGEVKAVADMHERKSEMAKHADAFIALPGHNILNSYSYISHSSQIFVSSTLIKTYSHCTVENCISGGYGTMEELLEVITWSQLGIHDKPVRIYF